VASSEDDTDEAEGREGVDEEEETKGDLERKRGGLR
jgi:hypothetical protein